MSVSYHKRFELKHLSPDILVMLALFCIDYK